MFQNTWTQQITSFKIPPEYLLTYHEAERVAWIIKLFPEDIRLQYRILMAKVIATLFIVLAAFSGLAFVASLFSKNLSMDRETKSAQQFQEKKKKEYVGI